MSEHVHDWHFDAFGDGIIAMCVSRDCETELTAAEVSRRLNATESLSADSATLAASFIWSEYQYKGWEESQAEAYKAYSDSLSYAAALDGEDG